MRSTVLPQRRQRRYTIAARVQLLLAYEDSPLSANAICVKEGIPRSTWQTWLRKKDVYVSTLRNKKRSTLGGQGRPVIMPFGQLLLSYMQSVRRDTHFLTTAHMALCQRFAHRHGFGQRVPCYSKLKRQELVQVKEDFAAAFWIKQRNQPLRDIVNVDEIAVYFDMPPRRTWSEVGEDSKLNASEKHADRLTAVMSLCADGTKLPILYILRGAPGGKIETEELPLLPGGHVYAVQENAWMDESVWVFYLKELLRYEILGPTVILLDNLSAHVSSVSYKTVDEELFSFVEPLPPNSTSVCQPLDVGVMGPLKAKMRALWLTETPVVSASDKRRMMVERTIRAWDSMSEATVKRSFEKALPRAQGGP